MAGEPRHIPVLLEATLAALAPAPGETFLDCTAGLGGHAAAIGSELGTSGMLVLNDADPGNLRRAEARVRDALPEPPRVVALQGNFADAPRRVREMDLAFDLLLADLGFASSQMEDAARGLSFARDGPLDMRFDPSSPVTAAELVASLPEAELARIIAEYGEDRAARAIARKLVAARAASPILTTGQLADLVRSAVGRRPGRDTIDPATRTFQALRIAVNDEMGSLAALLAAIERGAADLAAGKASWLRAGARVAIISFHSLEDRAVKRAFAGIVAAGNGAHLTRKPVEADESELGRNPRSRSAKLRVVRIGGEAAVG
jgi:16S rRNA (cytosine1402-N4)-methyltransferase